jgi:hypothetical protein
MRAAWQRLRHLRVCRLLAARGGARVQRERHRCNERRRVAVPCFTLLGLSASSASNCSAASGVSVFTSAARSLDDDCGRRSEQRELIDGAPARARSLIRAAATRAPARGAPLPPRAERSTVRARAITGAVARQLPHLDAVRRSRRRLQPVQEETLIADLAHADVIVANAY